jgi:hypothetical protein
MCGKIDRWKDSRVEKMMGGHVMCLVSGVVRYGPFVDTSAFLNHPMSCWTQHSFHHVETGNTLPLPTSSALWLWLLRRIDSTCLETNRHFTMANMVGDGCPLTNSNMFGGGPPFNCSTCLEMGWLLVDGGSQGNYETNAARSNRKATQLPQRASSTMETGTWLRGESQQNEMTHRSRV